MSGKLADRLRAALEKVDRALNAVPSNVLNAPPPYSSTKKRSGSGGFINKPRTLLRPDSLDERICPAVTAFFNTDVLVVTGDNAAQSINVFADDSGMVQVTSNNVSVPVISTFGTPVKTAVRTIFIDARGGSDFITLDKSLNVLDGAGKLLTAPNATLIGGNGNDSITSKMGGFVGGVIGNPIVGNTVMDGGNGNDFLDSGFGNDLMIGGAGNDTLRWLPGTLIDTFEGGDGNDNAVIVGNGNNQGDAFVLGQGSQPGRVLFQRTNLVPFFIDIGGTETVTMQTDSGDDTIMVNDLTGTEVTKVVADGGVGNDTITAAGQTSAAVSMNFFGGDGNDTITGGRGKDLLDGGAGDDNITGGGTSPALDGSNDSVIRGGDGNDTLISGFGNDIISGGNGDDTYVWLPGTINDVFDGGAGTDLGIVIGNDTFQGQPAGDVFTLNPGPNGRLRFDRTNLVPFFVDFGTTEVIDLRPGAGADRVIVGDMSGVRALQRVSVDAGTGDDVVDFSAQQRAKVSAFILGGDGNDVLTGGAGDDSIAGGRGNDTLNGGAGTDVLSGDQGRDTLIGGADGRTDTLIGGGGADRFVDQSTPDSPFEQFIADFNPDVDELVFNV